MGYRGKTVEQERARELREEAWTLEQIARELGVAKSSVSRWVREVAFEPQPRRAARSRGPNRLQLAKADEIESLRQAGRERVGELTEREFLMAGIALYAGERAKTDGNVRFANSDPRMIDFSYRWFRTFFELDEQRLRVQLYLHEGLDLDEAISYWSALTRYRRRSSSSPTERFPTPASGRQNTAMDVRASRIVALEPIERFLGSCRRC